MIFYVKKLTVPHNRIDQTSLNIHLIVHGIEKRQKEAILKYTDLTNAQIVIAIHWKIFYYSHKTQLLKKASQSLTVNNILICWEEE